MKTGTAGRSPLYQVISEARYFPSFPLSPRSEERNAKQSSSARSTNGVFPNALSSPRLALILLLFPPFLFSSSLPPPSLSVVSSLPRGRKVIGLEFIFCPRLSHTQRGVLSFVSLVSLVLPVSHGELLGFRLTNVRARNLRAVRGIERVAPRRRRASYRRHAPPGLATPIFAHKSRGPRRESGGFRNSWLRDTANPGNGSVGSR